MTQINNPEYYSSDPLARFLIGKLRLSPIQFALLWATFTVGVGVVTALLSGVFFSQPGQIGLLQDWIYWFWSFFLTPVLAGYYLWGATAMAGLLQGLQLSDVVTITDDDENLVVGLYKRNWRTLVSVIMAVTVGISYFATRPIFPGFASAAFAPRLGTTVIYTIGSYALSTLILTLILNVWSLRRIFANKNFHINPLHPDRCGGLRVLSTYSLKTAYLVAVFGIIIGISEFRWFAEGVAQQYWQVHLAVPLYLIIAFATFFSPLSTAHTGMEKAKMNLLNNIAKQFRQDYELAHNGLNKSSDTLKDEVIKIQQLRTLYDLTDKFPVWPFDTKTLQRFFISITTPLIPAVVGLLIELLRSFLVP